MSKTTKRRVIVTRLETLNTSTYGNPRYRIHTEDGSYISQSDASFCYGIENNRARRADRQPATLTLTPGGRVCDLDWHPVEPVPVYALYMRTTNDGNGNPRRGWLVSDVDGVVQGFADEGYAGTRSLDRAAVTLGVQSVPVLFTVDVTPGAYRAALKHARLDVY